MALQRGGKVDLRLREDAHWGILAGRGGHLFMRGAPREGGSMTRREYDKYRKEWRETFASFGGFAGAGATIADLQLGYHIPWNTATGEVGQTRWFLLNLYDAAHRIGTGREIEMPPGVRTVYDAYNILRTAGVYVIGLGAFRAEWFRWRTRTPSRAEFRRAKKRRLRNGADKSLSTRRPSFQ